MQSGTKPAGDHDLATCPAAVPGWDGVKRCVLGWYRVSRLRSLGRCRGRLSSRQLERSMRHRVGLRWVVAAVVGPAGALSDRLNDRGTALEHHAGGSSSPPCGPDNRGQEKATRKVLAGALVVRSPAWWRVRRTGCRALAQDKNGFKS